MILDAANPILYFQFLRIISYVIFPSVHWSPLWSYWHRFPLIYLFLPFSLPAFNVNSQSSLIVVLLCDLLYSYVLLIHLIHRLFWFSMYHLFLLLAFPMLSKKFPCSSASELSPVSKLALLSTAFVKMERVSLPKRRRIYTRLYGVIF